MLAIIVTNLARRRARTALTALGIGVGVGTVVALLSLTAGLSSAASGLTSLGKADIGIFQAGLADPTSSSLPEPLVGQIRALPGIDAAAGAQIITGALRADPAFLLFGLAPDGFVARRLVIVSGRRAGPAEAMVGDVEARRLGLHPGDRLVLAQGRLSIAGIYHSGVTFEDSGGSVDLPLAQRLTGRQGEVTTIAASLSPNTRTADAVQRIQRAFPGTVAITDPGQLVRAGANTRLIDKVVVVIAVLSLIIGAISVSNTMVLSVSERQSELGLLAAVGWSPSQIAGLVFGEGIGLGLIGSLVGLLLGIGLSSIAVAALSASAFITPHITAWGLGRGVLIGVAIGMLGGLYPAWRVSRLRPAQALARA